MIDPHEAPPTPARPKAAKRSADPIELVVLGVFAVWFLSVLWLTFGPIPGVR